MRRGTPTPYCLASSFHCKTLRENLQTYRGERRPGSSLRDRDSYLKFVEPNDKFRQVKIKLDRWVGVEFGEEIVVLKVGLSKR